MFYCDSVSGLFVNVDYDTNSEIMGQGQQEEICLIFEKRGNGGLCPVSVHIAFHTDLSSLLPIDVKCRLVLVSIRSFTIYGHFLYIFTKF